MAIQSGGISIPVGADLRPFEKGLKKAESLAAGFGAKLKKTMAGAVWDGASFAAGLKKSNREFAAFADSARKAKEEYGELLQLNEKLKSTGLWDHMSSRAQASMENAVESARIKTEAYGRTLKHMGRGQAVKKLFTGLKAGFETVGKVAGKVFGGIAKWAKRLGLAIIAAGLVMLKQGLDNLYKADSRTKESIDGLKKSLTALKNALAAAFAPILNTVTPILQKFIGFLTKAANAVAHFFAALTGQKTVTVATEEVSDSMAGISDNASEANENAKELQRTLMGFDKINKLDSQDTGSGSSSSSSGTGGGTGFETVPVSGTIADWADKFKQAWEDADFTEIGGIIGTKLKNALDNINWEGIQATGAKIAKSLATGLNGFFETEGLGTSIGNTIAEALNTVTITLDTFAVEFHWDSFGQFIADEINGFFDTFNFSLLGKTLSDWANGLLTAAIKAVQGVNWGNVGSKIVDLIAGVNWVSLFVNSVTLVTSLTNGVFQALMGAANALVSKLGEFGGKVVADISTYFQQHKPTISLDLPTWESIQGKWESFKSKFTTNLNMTLKLPKWSKLKKEWNSLKSKFKSFSVNATIKFKTSFNDMKAWVNSYVIGPLNNAIRKVIPKFTGIDYLAQGGYVRANTPQLAVIGDNKHEGEIVAPESKLQAMANAASGAGNAEVIRLLSALLTAVENIDPDVYLDGESIKNNTVRRINNHTRATGQLELVI